MQVGLGAVWMEGWLHGRFGVPCRWASVLCGWRDGCMGGMGHYHGGLLHCVAGGVATWEVWGTMQGGSSAVWLEAVAWLGVFDARAQWAHALIDRPVRPWCA